MIDNDVTPEIIQFLEQFATAMGIRATVKVDGVVVGDFQNVGTGQLAGFFLQEEDSDVDADPATSEGILVFCGGCPTAVAEGDRVQATLGHDRLKPAAQGPHLRGRIDQPRVFVACARGYRQFRAQCRPYLQPRSRVAAGGRMGAPPAAACRLFGAYALRNLFSLL